MIIVIILCFVFENSYFIETMSYYSRTNSRASLARHAGSRNTFETGLLLSKTDYTVLL